MKSGIDLLVKGAQEIGIQIEEPEREKFRLYSCLLQEGNKMMNLVRYSNEDELYRAHFLDSLMCSTGYDFNQAARVIDLGSGAGFPAVPLKICFPHLQFWLVDSRNKRCDFLRRVIEELKLKACFVVWDRLENIAHRQEHRGCFDCAVARAVAPLGVLLELGLPFLKSKGKLIALKGYKADEEITAARRASEVLGGTVEMVVPYGFPGERGRNVIVLSKQRPTATVFPRKPGIPAKKPL